MSCIQKYRQLAYMCRTTGYPKANLVSKNVAIFLSGNTSASSVDDRDDLSGTYRSDMAHQTWAPPSNKQDTDMQRAVDHQQKSIADSSEQGTSPRLLYYVA